jgi:hypothetical protein
LPPDDGNRYSFENVGFGKTYDDGKLPKNNIYDST